MSLNINRAVEDQFYRYKMPKLVTKVEGRGNGIKTVMVNMLEVSRALSCPPAYPTKFFGCELGSQTILDDANNRYVVNGSHETSVICDLLDKFIRRYILCPKCDLPELVTGIKKGLYQAACGACGFNGPLDQNHRVIAYIIRNPPKMVSLSKKGKGDSKGDKPGKGAGKKVKGAKNKTKDAASSAAKSPNPATRKKDEVKEKKGADDDDDDDWAGVDVSEEAIKARREQQEAEMSARVKGMIANEIDEKDLGEEERLKMLKTFAQDKVKTGKEIFEEAKRLDVLDTGISVIVEVKLTEQPVEALQANKTLLLLFCKDKPAEQRVLLGAIERLVGVTNPAALPKLNKILQIFYEEDIVDEHEITVWHGQSSSSYTSNNLLFKKIKAAADKFVEWLENAESETDSEDDVAFTKAGSKGEGDTKADSGYDDDDDDDDDDVLKVTPSEARGTGSKFGIKKVEEKASEDEDDDSDIDLDDI